MIRNPNAWGACLALTVWAAGLAAAEPTLPEARRLLLTGKYAEAEEAYEALRQASPVAAAVGLAEAQRATGRRSLAEKTLEAALAAHAGAAELHAGRARLAFEAGRAVEARAAAERALQLEPNQALARWIQAELYRESGQLAEAGKAYAWFVEFYNAGKIPDAEALRWIGRGAAQHARWKRGQELFSDLVNDLFPEALEREKEFWPAHYEAALIWLEKFNKAEASRELKAALALNPQAAECYCGLARLALQGYDLDRATAALDRAAEINPELPEVHWLRADVRLANFDLEGAIDILEKRALPLRPTSEETLGRLAAAHLARDGGWQRPEGTRAGELLAAATERNSAAGVLYLTLGETLENLRKFSAAEKFLREAQVRMPQLIGPQAALGMLHLRLGEERAGREQLEAAFKADPFHVRVSNTLKVLEVLDNYETLETAHFLIRHDPRDKLLARYAGKYLEEVYPGLVKQFGFEPPQKSLFEIFHRARNTNGHGWFSARMVGLPSLGTVGACAGKMVAIASPNDMPQPYNWARVLKHEFVHVINLQQTDFNLPHWFAEALAVLNEGFPRSPEWNALLAERFAAEKLFTLDDINFGFIRPQSSDDWTMAYCQAELYAEYMLHRHGPDALARLLAAFGKNLNTRQAIRAAFDVEQEAFDADFRRYVAEVVRTLSPGDGAREPDEAAVERVLARDPKDPEANAQAALFRLNAKQFPQARSFAEKALAVKPKHQRAGYVIARLHLLTGETEACLKRLEDCLDRQAPDEHVLALLGGLYYRAEKFQEAAELYELGAKRQPGTAKWLKYLARVYLQTEDSPKLYRVLAQLAALDADDLGVRKKLAQLALSAEEFESARDWAQQSLQINVLDADAHHLYAQALAALRRPADSADEAEVAIELAPDDLAPRLLAVRGRLAARQFAQARAGLAELEKRAGDNAEVKALAEQLRRAEKP